MGGELAFLREARAASLGCCLTADGSWATMHIAK